jgi:predicted cobalt transporter CbtA
MKPYLLRGALAGVAGSVASVLALLLLGESSINRAIELEEANAVAGEAHEELFSRGTQVVGGVVALVLFGVCVGLVFGVVYAATRHRLGADAEWRRARRLGAAAFVGVFLVPFLKYPANPPAVGDPDTIGSRTIAYASMVIVSVLAIVLAAAVHDRLRRGGLGEERAQPIAVLAWLVIVGVAMVVLPANPDELNIPAELVWSFRMASIGGQAAFWAVTATAFGLLSVQATAQRGDTAPATTPPATGSATKLA